MRKCSGAATILSLSGVASDEEIIGNLGEIYERSPRAGRSVASTLDKLNEIAPTCFITGAHGPKDSTTRNYRDVGPGPQLTRGVDGAANV